MSTYQLSPAVGTIRLVLPTRQEIRTAMLTRPGVAIAGIIAVTVILVAFASAIVVLALNDKSTEALTFAIVAPVVGMLATVMGRVRSIESKVDAAAVTNNADPR